MKRIAVTMVLFGFLFCFAGCGTKGVLEEQVDSDSGQEETPGGISQEKEEAGDLQEVEEAKSSVQKNQSVVSYTRNTKISEVINDPVFGEYGRLIFPADSGYYSGDTLEEVELVWYNNIDPDKTVEIANYLRDHATAGDPVFYDIYTEEEKASDPAKENTGLFFFQGNPGAEVCSMQCRRRICLCGGNA